MRMLKTDKQKYRKSCQSDEHRAEMKEFVGTGESEEDHGRTMEDDET